MTEIDEGPAPGVRSILEDKEGNFWFSSNFKHKYKLLDISGNTQLNELEYQKNNGINASKFPSLGSFCMSFTQDNKGDIWMATYDSGVWRYDGQKISHYPIQIEGKDILLFSIYKDNAGTLWLGTHNEGALKFNGTTFERFMK